MCRGSLLKYIDDPNIITNTNSVYVNAWSYISTIKQNSNFFTDFEVEGARKIREL